MTIPVNPYVTGIPVGNSSAFIGREDVLREVRRILGRPQDNAIVLYGQRRIGKTSILQHLELRLPTGGLYRPVYFDLQYKADFSLEQLLQDLALTIATVLNQAAPDLGPDPQIAFQDEWLPAILDKLADGCSLVLLFDEFDVLADSQEQQAANDFFPYLRNLFTRAPQRLQFVFAIGRNVDDLDNIALSLFKGVPYQRVSLLNKKDAAHLVRLSQANSTLHWAEEAVDHVWQLTCGHPFLTQQICSHVWERAHEEEPDTPPTVTSTDVENALRDALDSSRNTMEWLWGGLPPAERVVVSALAEAGPGPITRDELEHILRESGVRVVIRSLQSAPQLLKAWDILESVEDGYRFRVESLRRWIVENKPLYRVQDELDRIQPTADNLYQAALGFERSERLDQAVDLLRQAVEWNPNHLGANELLAEILLAQGKASEARQLLEQLYEYQPGAARPRLVQALLAQARASKSDRERLPLYERVLELETEQPEATAGRRRIQMQELEVLEQSRRYRDALNLARELADEYPEARDWTSKTNEIEQKIRLHDLNVGLQELEALEQEGQYQDALTLARELEGVFPEARDWSTRTDEIELRMHRRELVVQLQQIKEMEQEEQYQLALDLAQKLAAASEYAGMRDWKPDLDRLKHKTGLAEKCHRLSPWNPLDHLRLLWWMLVTPQRIKVHREVFEKSEHKVGRWLASTLIWLPLFIPILALGFRILSQTEETSFSIAYFGISLGLAVAWVLTGRLADSGSVGAAIVAVTIAVVVAGGETFLVATGLTDSTTIIVASIVAVAVAGIVAGGEALTVAGGEAFVVTFVSAFVAAFVIAGSVAAGGLAFIVTFVAMFVAIGGLADTVKTSLETGQPSWLARAALGVLLLAYTLMIWFSFLDSGQTSQ